MSPRRAAAALRPTLLVVAVTGLALALLAVAVLALGDGRCFTPPPESMAEQFVWKLGMRRWTPARGQLTPELAAAVDEGTLRAAMQDFEARWGRIREVQAQAGPLAGGQAWAYAEVTTSRHERVSMALPMLRRSGVWRVAGLPPIIQAH